ncbi:hypothetical protein [Bifidobacterium pullorum]|uniref:hypothetical protein n=1 Tax=Bifidobacterium pullorum TaxID=78448 RepID=UPI001269A85A|nr:hypothetical protein [Bifidobacterium pullorum]
MVTNRAPPAMPVRPQAFGHSHTGPVCMRNQSDPTNIEIPRYHPSVQLVPSTNPARLRDTSMDAPRWLEVPHLKVSAKL